MNTKLHWARKSPSPNNYDLVLTNVTNFDSFRASQLLNEIEKEKHRGLSLSGRANREFRRWIHQPGTPLKSDAYVLLSNWFCTNSGDRRSTLASRCEDFWDELFPCRPTRRLSSPEPGKNHAIVPSEFEQWWRSVLIAQGDEPASLETAPAHPALAPTFQPIAPAFEGDARLTQMQETFRPMTIAEAKAALARTFGVTTDKIEITIRG